MLLYNTTFAFDRAIERDVLQWLASEFIPSAVADGEYFAAPELFRVEAHGADPDTLSYALHLRAPSEREINLWYEDHGSRLVAEMMQRWGGRALCFSTTLCNVDHGADI